MIRPWTDLKAQERDAFRSAVAFLDGRLEEQGTIDWALGLKAQQQVERIAVIELLTRPRAQQLAEPWTAAWRLIEESWSTTPSDWRSRFGLSSIQQRLRTGDLSGPVADAIVDLVEPRLMTHPRDARLRNLTLGRRAPKTFRDVLSASLTSGELVDINTLSLTSIDNVMFLSSLANKLESAVNKGIDIARKLGWDEKKSFRLLGGIYRVYYKRKAREGTTGIDVDSYNLGIAPSLKLLYETVSRLADIRPEVARIYMERWLIWHAPIFNRLWSAMARNNRLAEDSVVAAFLGALDDRQFWNSGEFPEIAELRAVRFNEFDAAAKGKVLARIKKGPPRNRWQRNATADEIQSAREYSALLEFRRIEISGATLPARIMKWMVDRQPRFPDLAQMTADEGFPEGGIAEVVPPNPDGRYDSLRGVARLQTLESALVRGRDSWISDPASRASDWIAERANADRVLSDLEGASLGGDEFPAVWDQFCWTHRPSDETAVGTTKEIIGAEGRRVLFLLNHLSEQTLSKAISGITAWLDNWQRHVARLPETLPIWLRLWPIAAEITNRTPEKFDKEDLNVSVHDTNDDRERMDLDTLNTPAGKLVGVFLAACPGSDVAFHEGAVETQMRDTAIAADGRSGLIAKHRMIESLRYFLTADRTWALLHLVEPLKRNDAASLALWRAVARSTHFKDALQVFGQTMVARVSDTRLGRETRRRLVFSLVVESLNAFREGRCSAVSNDRIQQMLRTLDDEVRASAAKVIPKFVREIAARPPNDSYSKAPGEIFRVAALPFLRNVWPQERSLTTPGISSALADLPAAAEEAFAEAVEAVARFLEPFECWSMHDYGFYNENHESIKFDIIDNKEKAHALLKLFDLTIGTTEGSVVPYELASALDKISEIEPSLTRLPEFRRLSTVARR